MTHQVKLPATRPDYLGLTSETHVVGEIQIPQIFLSPPQKCCITSVNTRYMRIKFKTNEEKKADGPTPE